MEKSQITFDHLTHRYDEVIAQFLMREIDKTEGRESPVFYADEAVITAEIDVQPASWAMASEPLIPLIGEIALLEQIFTRAKPSHYTKRYQQIAARCRALEDIIQTTPGHSLATVIWKVSKLVAGIREDEDKASEVLLKITEVILEDLIRLACLEEAIPA